MTRSRIAVVQMTSSMEVEVNLTKLSELFVDLMATSVDAIFLPENFAAFGTLGCLEIGRDELSEPSRIRSFLAEQAVALDCCIFAGTVPLAARPDGVRVEEDRVRAASLVFDQQGKQIARYDKIHLFDVDVNDNQQRYRESDRFEAGNTLEVVESPIGAVGLSVCYDIRFPEMYRDLVLAGAEILAVPSAFTRVTGQAHYQVLMQARAIENFCFVVAACQVGCHDSGRETYGHSMVVNPWGEVVAERLEGEGVIITEIDLDEVAEARMQVPAWRMRNL
ncbi:MAG: carbon-nitrogen hydrolase family protein, partial [Gammaproteobacteria bacterium]|nr:carbon-nitrogen hydrolase family protein [Gammaproteobacteria bacterium]MBT5202319.1 carbon-nitrogen hydrolase family protein [Gammaproteobacteria bacterium]MBT5600623.1 carbon-nitrogen hydrolase family protein [Gammaproteobacteria bacterium]MBT6245119.1 carbon-nitrogen hydrolase family protein [Gammaproteobacteria bacterium]